MLSSDINGFQGDELSDLVRILLEKLLGRAQRELYARPTRRWQEIDGPQRAGRVALIVAAFLIVLLPLGWLIFR